MDMYTMRWRRALCRRRGAAMFETAVVLSVFLMLVLGFLDLGVATFRYHLVSQAARHGARQAIVHGSMAPAAMGTWGPTAVAASANATGVPLVDAVKPYLIGFDLSQTQVNATWLDGSNDPGLRVQVVITTSYRPVVPFVLGTTPMNLRGASTLTIAH